MWEQRCPQQAGRGISTVRPHRVSASTSVPGASQQHRIRQELMRTAQHKHLKCLDSVSVLEPLQRSQRRPPRRLPSTRPFPTSEAHMVQHGGMHILSTTTSNLCVYLRPSHPSTYGTSHPESLSACPSGTGPSATNRVKDNPTESMKIFQAPSSHPTQPPRCAPSDAKML